MPTPRTDHDPLCDEFGNGGWIPGVGDCQCDLIARVRADERSLWICQVCSHPDVTAEAVSAERARCIAIVSEVRDERIATVGGSTDLLYALRRLRATK
jgi:hypothetical protein